MNGLKTRAVNRFQYACLRNIHAHAGAKPVRMQGSGDADISYSDRALPASRIGRKDGVHIVNKFPISRDIFLYYL